MHYLMFQCLNNFITVKIFKRVYIVQTKKGCCQLNLDVFAITWFAFTDCKKENRK